MSFESFNSNLLSMLSNDSNHYPMNRIMHILCVIAIALGAITFFACGSGSQKTTQKAGKESTMNAEEEDGVADEENYFSGPTVRPIQVDTVKRLCTEGILVYHYDKELGTAEVYHQNLNFDGTHVVIPSYLELDNFYYTVNAI